MELKTKWCMYLLTDNAEMKQVQLCKIYISFLKCLEVNAIFPRFLEKFKNALYKICHFLQRSKSKDYDW